MAATRKSTTPHTPPLTEADRDNWTPIPGYEGWYEAHPDGRIRRVPREPGISPRELRPGWSASSGLVVALSINGRVQTLTVARLVARTFIGEPPARSVIAFTDEDRRNVAAANLSYAKQRRAVPRRITAEQAMRIYHDYHHHGQTNLEQLATTHQTTVTIVDRIVRGKSWQYYTQPTDAIEEPPASTTPPSSPPPVNTSRLRSFTTTTLTAQLTPDEMLILTDRHGTTITCTAEDVAFLRQLMSSRAAAHAQMRRAGRPPTHDPLIERIVQRLTRAPAKGLSAHDLAELLRAQSDAVREGLQNLLRSGRVTNTMILAANGRKVTYWHLAPQK